MTFAFSGTLLRFADYRREVAIVAPTLGEALAALAKQMPTLQPVLFDAKGSLRAVHRLFLNGEQLLALEPSRALSADDRVEVLTAIAGG